MTGALVKMLIYRFMSHNLFNNVWNTGVGDDALFDRVWLVGAETTLAPISHGLSAYFGYTHRLGHIC